MLLLLSSVPLTLAVVPDEGMYMLDQVNTLPIGKKGAKVKATDIFNPNGPALSDAVVRVIIGTGGHGTGELISDKGLVLTNHHVGFDALVAASTEAKDYATNGYASTSNADELQAKDYAIEVTQKVENVTAKVNAGIAANASDADRKAALDKNIADIQKTASAGLPAGTTVTIQSINNGVFYYLFQIMRLKDVRVVYAPPKNIGFFGGDPDNFEWSRHTGDFTFLRAYTAPDGSPAAYAQNNIPYKPKKSLTISLAGVQDNDFTMVLGYPGGTTRYRESQSVAYNQNVRMPLLVRYFQANIAALKAEGDQDPVKKIALQSDIFSFANSEKAFDGGVIAMRHANVIDAKKAEEARFETWVNADPARKAKYGEVLPSFARTYEEFNKNAQKNLALNLLASSTPLFKFLSDAAASAKSGKTLSAEESAKVRTFLTEALKTRNVIAEAELVKSMLREAAMLPAGQKIEPVEAMFGSMQGAARVKAEEDFVRSLMETNVDTILAVYSPGNAKDSAIVNMSFAIGTGEIPAAQQRGAKLNTDVAKLRALYIEGWSAMNNKTPYPDANSTLRFSYGNIKGYVPREATTYTPFTTLAGVLEKDTGIEPFDVPQKLKDLYKAKDFGRYAGMGSVPVNFLTTNDIIGGNSGSPILNAKGEQVGIVFDGNYEGLGNDFFYNDAKGRTIAVDIRYVLFVTEKMSGVNWFFPELNITGAPKMKG
jgi:hypothetical protein